MTAQVDAIDTKYTGLFLSYFLIFFFQFSSTNMWLDAIT